MNVKKIIRTLVPSLNKSLLQNSQKNSPIDIKSEKRNLPDFYFIRVYFIPTFHSF